MNELPPPLPGSEAIALSGLAAFAEHAVQLVEAARMDVAILSPVLDRRIFGDERLIAAVRSFVLQHRRARLRILVLQPGRTMQSGHRLVELGRMLSSRIEFRQPDPERPVPAEEFLVADERIVLSRSPEETEASYAVSPLLARQQLRTFNALWEISPPARELSELKL
jgi:hypothetical protein